MKNKILSTVFGLMLTFGMLLPLNHSFVNVQGLSASHVNVNGNICIKVLADGTKVNTCDLQQLDVSWNSGAG
ncbi:MAG: hypothetical protein R2932_04515 [Caldilineaceae bacterium]